MQTLLQSEISFIEKIIANGKESFFVEFKEEYKHIYKCNTSETEALVKDKAKAHVNEGLRVFIRECLGFLNELSISDKYLIFGVCDDGKVIGVPPDVQIREESIQERIESYITPCPKIRVIDNFIYEGKRLIIFKIDKSNQQKIYTLGKNINAEKGTLTAGESFLRSGTVVKKITSLNAIAILKQIDNSVFTLLSANNEFAIEKAEKILKYVEIIDMIIDKSALDICLQKNINLLVHFNNSFEKHVLKAKFEDANDPECIDGGFHTFCDGLFFIAKLLFEISEDNYFMFVNQNTKLLFSSNNDTIDNDKFFNTKKKIDKINQLLKEYMYSIGIYGESYIFKITQLQFSNDIENMYGDGNLKFTASDEIMHLFLEPLYSRNNTLFVTIRELMQNAFDACKKRGKFDDNYSAEVKISFELKENELKYVHIQDNGIGMDLPAIKTNYLTVGKSTKSDDTSVGLIGRFGIGALANFLIGTESEIITKRSDSKIEYRFLIQKNGFLVKNLLGKQVDNNTESYTKVSIEVSDEIAGYFSSDDLIKEKLELNTLIICDDVALTFEFIIDGEKIEEVIPVITENQEYFINVDFGGTSNADIRIFNNSDPDTKDESTADTYKLAKTNANKILYNNQLGKSDFVLPNGIQNIDSKNIPLIVINGYISEQEGYTPELSRNQYRIDSVLAENISKKLYQIGVPKLIFKINELNNISENVSLKIAELENCAKSESLKLPSISIKGNKISLITSNKDQIDYKIYTNELESSTIQTLMDNNTYIQETIRSEKTAVADIVESEQAIILSKRFFERFILNANSPQNGFRYVTLCILLKRLGYQELIASGPVGDTWANIRDNKTKLEITLSNCEKNGLIPITPSGTQLLQKLGALGASITNVSNLIVCENPEYYILPDAEFIDIYKREITDTLSST